MSAIEYYHYANAIVSILKQEKAQTFTDLKCRIAALGDDYKDEEKLGACLDDLVNDGMLICRQERRDDELVELYRFRSTGSQTAGNINTDSGDEKEQAQSGKIRFIREHCKPTDAGYIALVDVRVDDTFRCRESEDEDAVESYTVVFKEYNRKPSKEEERRLKCGFNIDDQPYPFPPAWVWQEGEQYYLIAGFHRFQAATKAKLEKLLVKEFHGTKEEAIQFAIKDNLKNGLRLSCGDWKYCISKALRLFPGKTPGAVAKELGCSRSYAYKIDKELSTSGQLPDLEKKVGADGKERSVNRKAKQSTVVPAKESDSAPVPAPPSKKETATSEPKPQDSPKNDAPFVFVNTTPVAPMKSIKPSSPELESEMNKTIYNFRRQLSHHRQEDCPYVLYRLREFLEILGEEWDEIKLPK